MTEPWFDPYAWIPGTLLGVTAGLFGGVVGGYLAPRGKARRLALSIHIGLIIISALLLIAGVVAYLQGQPTESGTGWVSRAPSVSSCWVSISR